MAYQALVSELFIALSDEQQEHLAGGVDFELAGSNFANRIANLQGSVSSGPDGSTANSTGSVTAVNTAAQDFLGLGAASVPTVEALGTAPVLNGIGTVTNGE
ncbi:CTB family bacteriocin [Nostocales cyanobacterium LEGE 11386]|nr:CTB family bacteriocin [Nostocales cyanobacterium LEGE 11386]